MPREPWFPLRFRFSLESLPKQTFQPLQHHQIHQLVGDLPAFMGDTHALSERRVVSSPDARLAGLAKEFELSLDLPTTPTTIDMSSALSAKTGTKARWRWQDVGLEYPFTAEIEPGHSVADACGSRKSKRLFRLSTSIPNGLGGAWVSVSRKKLNNRLHKNFLFQKVDPLS